MANRSAEPTMGGHGCTTPLPFARPWSGYVLTARYRVLTRCARWSNWRPTAIIWKVAPWRMARGGSQDEGVPARPQVLGAGPDRRRRIGTRFRNRGVPRTPARAILRENRPATVRQSPAIRQGAGQ